MPTPRKYFLPSFLEGIVPLKEYAHWLDDRAGQLFARDRKRKIPYALNGSKRLYKEAIDRAAQSGAVDPFTGDALRWDLIGKWPSTKEGQAALDDGRRKAFALLPVVDHIDPYAGELAFEICSMQINRCKSFWTPEEFVGLCRAVVDFTQTRGCVNARRREGVTKYGLPDFLQGRVAPGEYSKWTNEHGCQLYMRDIRLKRPCATGSSVPIYTEQIHEAVCRGGQADPFTGQALAWEMVGTWDVSAPWAHDPAIMKKFALLPSVDHMYPRAEALEFEICSLAINECKSSFTPEEFVELCRRIVDFADAYKHKKVE